MTPDDLASLHAQCFDDAPRPWSAREFHDLLALPHSFLLTRPQGFLLGRVIADEAELLTLAVAPAARRQGVARDLTADFAATSQRRGAAAAFLEVAADNTAARALYDTLGWQDAGVRRNYYRPGRDAVVMRLDLPPAQKAC